MRWRLKRRWKKNKNPLIMWRKWQGVGVSGCRAATMTDEREAKDVGVGVGGRKREEVWMSG